MVVSIHQPHYFPWMGYFDKIAKADAFIILDQVQFEKGSYMIRNRVLSDTGEIKYITISADTKNYLNREYRDLQIKSPEEWKSKHINALINYYRKAPFKKDIIRLLEDFLSNNYETLCEWTCKSIDLVCNLLGIATKIMFQSDISCIDEVKKSDLVLSICKALNADCYFSGRGGSVQYLDAEKFNNNGIEIVFQTFAHPLYRQCNSELFIPGLSILDVLFNCGIEKTRDLFWESYYSENVLLKMDRK